jgi:hypothetical protein
VRHRGDVNIRTLESLDRQDKVVGKLGHDLDGQGVALLKVFEVVRAIGKSREHGASTKEAL